MTVRIERMVTSGTFQLNGGSWEVENNDRAIGDGQEVIVIDAAHDDVAIAVAVGPRRLAAIVCTHGHNDHVNAAPVLADRTGAPIPLHPADDVLGKAAQAPGAPDYRD